MPGVAGQGYNLKATIASHDEQMHIAKLLIWANAVAAAA
jgi:hypothetical protein